MIVDDHPLVREGLALMLADNEEIEVVQTAADAKTALAAYAKIAPPPDIVISDVRMPGMSGLEMLDALKRIDGGAKVLFLAGLPRRDEEDEARRLGARGYMSKSADTTLLTNTVIRIAKGLVVFASDAYAKDDSPLTAKETELLGYFALGKTREEIAMITGCSPETVKSRSAIIRRKLDVTNTAAAVFRAKELGYLR